jgi:methionyl-tRNA formyltransferase
MIVVHDDHDFIYAVKNWSKRDGLSLDEQSVKYMSESAAKATGEFCNHSLHVLVKCHTLWSKLPRHCIVIHDGDLSKYRGCSPMRHAIAAGEKQVVITAFQPTDVVDYGWIYGQQVFSIPEHWEPFCASWNRSARAYAKLLSKIEKDFFCTKRKRPIAPPPRMGRVYKRWGDRMTQEYLSLKQGTDTIYWGLRACGPACRTQGRLGKLDGYTVKWAELSSAAEDYEMRPGEHRLEMRPNLIRFACADWRTMIAEVK